MPHQNTSWDPALGDLLGVLALEQLEVNLFRGTSPDDGWQRVFGGQVLAQALAAAARTLDDKRSVHSLHAYFLLGGDPLHPIIYEVERTRDGGSFTTRRVKAVQHGRVIFTVSASFHKPETGLEHQAQMPDVPGPDGLVSLSELMRRNLDKLPPHMRGYFQRQHPIELRPVDLTRYVSREGRAPQQHIWLKANGRLPDCEHIHECVLAYASDFTLLDTALIAHGRLLYDRDLQLASLDHAMWLHRPFRADEWLLYTQDSPNASGARGFGRGSVFTQDGRLVASVAQEGLIRPVPAP